MIIHLLAPFFTGSHQKWAEGYAENSQHIVKIFKLPGKYWKWRMHGAAVQLAQQFNEQDEVPDVIFATDMLDLTTFLALTKQRTATIPTAIYFHENQLTYPWSPTDEDVDLQRDRHYAWINYTAALVADQVFFNSNYHKNSFLEALPTFLRAFPDFKGLENVDKIARKSKVLCLGLDLSVFDQYKPKETTNKTPVLLWNHRWEYDKNPKAFFQLCYQLKREKFDFQLIVLGENYAKAPAVFKEAKELLSENILHWGYAPNVESYAQWLWQADILPVTSQQDFFGGSVVEAMYCGVYPLLPKRLAFPEHIPTNHHAAHLYQGDEDLFIKMKKLLKQMPLPKQKPYAEWIKHYDWAIKGVDYDEKLLLRANNQMKCDKNHFADKLL